MNCPVCGNAYVMGSDNHRNCDQVAKDHEQHLRDLEKRIENLEDRIFQYDGGQWN